MGQWHLTVSLTPRLWSSWVYLNVQLKGVDGLLQHRRPLPLCQLDAVHPAPVQLFEAVGAGHPWEGEERKPLFAAQSQRLLGNFSQYLTSWQVTKISSVGMGHQQLRALFANLKDMKVAAIISHLVKSYKWNECFPLYSLFLVCEHIYVWLQARSLSSSSQSPKSAPSRFEAIPIGQVPGESKLALQLDDRNFHPAAPLAPCRSHGANTAEPDGNMEI